MSKQEVRKGEELPEKKTYLLSSEGKEYVLRKPPVGAIKRGHDMSREYKVQTAVKKEFSKVPKMFA